MFAKSYYPQWHNSSDKPSTAHTHTHTHPRSKKESRKNMTKATRTVSWNPVHTDPHTHIETQTLAACPSRERSERANSPQFQLRSAHAPRNYRSSSIRLSYSCCCCWCSRAVTLNSDLVPRHVDWTPGQQQQHCTLSFYSFEEGLGAFHFKWIRQTLSFSRGTAQGCMCREFLRCREEGALFSIYSFSFGGVSRREYRPMQVFGILESLISPVGYGGFNWTAWWI